MAIRKPSIFADSDQLGEDALKVFELAVHEWVHAERALYASVQGILLKSAVALLASSIWSPTMPREKHDEGPLHTVARQYSTDF